MDQVTLFIQKTMGILWHNKNYLADMYQIFQKYAGACNLTIPHSIKVSCSLVDLNPMKTNCDYVIVRISYLSVSAFTCFEHFPEKSIDVYKTYVLSTIFKNI